MTGLPSGGVPGPQVSAPARVRASIRLRGLAPRVLLGIALLLPALLAANLVWRFGVDVPYWDQWELVAPLDHLFAGTLRSAELFAQHNEHRILFPRMVMLGLARLTRWDTRAEMWVSYLLLVAVALTLLAEHRRAFGASWISLWLFVPAPWIMFSLRQSENLLWGWQLQVPLAALGVVLSMVAIERGGGRGLGLAIAGAVLASFSFAAGLAVWPAGLVLLTLRSEEWNRRVRVLTVWCASALLVIAAYLHGYAKPAAHPDAAFVLGNVRVSTHFFIAMTGAGLAGRSEPAAATAVGTLFVALLGLALLCVAWGRARLERARLGLALLVFSGCVVAMVTLGRAGFEAGTGGVAFALTSRYTTFTLLGVFGLYRVGLSLEKSRLRVAFTGALVCLVALGTERALASEFRGGAMTRRDRQTMQRTLLHHSSASEEELAQLYPHPDLLRERATVLQRLQLSVFRAR